jgi:hypothetical protein
MMPLADEWNTSDLPNSRRVYLDSGQSFEDIATSIENEAEIGEAWSNPYRHPPRGIAARQICFRIHVSKETYDLFYNAPDGLRGRYWQSPDLGFLATRSLIDALKPKLLRAVDEFDWRKLSPMTIAEIEASLEAASAKVWVGENRGSKISYAGPQLRVRRWELNESIPCSKGRQWRWTPIDRDLEIKGALLDSSGTEHIPKTKRDRSCQIHKFGFT